MLPLSLLNTAQGHPMLVELKNGLSFGLGLLNRPSFDLVL